MRGPEFERGPESERGAALLAVLAMVVLLASFATLGLSRLKAAGERISEAQTLSEAQLLAGTGTTAAVSVISQMKARARLSPALLTEPFRLELQGGTVEARFTDGGNCFNLNSLGRAPARANMSETPAASRPQDFARLLVATGIPLMEANTLAQATAARLAQTGQLWADPSEWAAIPGVTPRHWALAGPLLCALPTRENSTVNINSLTAAQAPLLTGLGLGADEARRAIGARPSAGWNSASDFMTSSGSNADQTGEAAERMGTSTRWMRLSIVATTPRARVARELLIDTLEQPAAVVSSRWRAVEEAS